MLSMVINCKYSAVLVIGLMLTSCGEPRAVSLDELKTYIQEPEHGLVQKTINSEITLEVLFRPRDLVIAQNMADGTDAEWHNAREQFDSLDYFVLKISRAGEEVQSKFAGNQSLLEDAVGYLSSGIQQDVSVVDRLGKVFKAEGVSFVPTFGISNGTNVLLVFKSFLQEDPRDFTMTFHDQMFGSGNSEFRFEGSDIENVPVVISQF